MQGIFVVEVNQGQKSQKNESRENPFLEELEREIAKLERISAEVTMRHAVVTHIRNELLKILELDREAEEPDEDEKTQTQENTSEKDSIKYEETQEKIDGGYEESLSDPMLRRLKIIESALKSVAAKLGEADMTSRFNQLGELHRNLESCVNSPNKQKEPMEYLVELETAIAEALNYLSNSKMAARFNLLKELRQDLEEALANSHAMTG